jgi:tetratricopeptide (TPR) repeat protein
VGAALWANGLYRAAVPLSLHDFDAPRRAADASLALVPTGAVLLTNADSVSFPLAYALYAGPGAAAETRWMAFASSGVPKRVGSAEAAGGWRPADRAALLAQVRARAAKSGPLTPPAPFPTLPSVPVFTDDAGDRPATARHFLPAGLLFELRDAPVSVAEVRAAEAHRRAEQPYLLRPAAPDENRLTRDMLGRQHLRRAAYFFALGMWPEADGAARLTLTYRPWEGAAWFLLGSCLENEGRPADAAAAYAGAIDAEPGLDGPRTNLAVLLATSGRGGEARPLLVEELRLHPANAEARTNLARLDRAFAAGVTNQK